MRVLVADRNGWLLESISRTFAREFRIEAATTHEQCDQLLRQVEFDLVVISEKLADGPGLHLLARIARSSPDTLRVFAARRSRLQLLKGKLGPFGLFRTLSYPINPRELLSVLTLSCAGLQTEMPVMEVSADAGARKQGAGREVSGVAAVRQEKGAASTVETVEAPTVKASIVNAPAAAPVAAAPKVGPSAERISFVRAAALISTNVPDLLGGKASEGRPAGVPRQAAVARETHGLRRRQAESHVRGAAPEAGLSRSSGSAQAVSPPVATPKRPDMSRQTEIPQRAQTPRSAPARQHAEVPQWAPTSRPAQMLAQPETPVPDLPHMLADPFAPVRLPSFSAQRSPRRVKMTLAATIAVVFLATTVAINLLGGGVHESHAAVAAVTEVEASSEPVVPPIATPVGTPAPFAPAAKVAQHSQPRPAAPESEVMPADQQVAASATPIADPSTFGSEAYEPIYSN